MRMVIVPGTTHTITILGEPAWRRMRELCADGEQAVVSARIVVQKEFRISQRVAICWEYWAVRMDDDRARSVIAVGTPRFGATRRIAHSIVRDTLRRRKKGEALGFAQWRPRASAFLQSSIARSQTMLLRYP